MREWIDKLLTSLKAGLPAWTHAFSEIKPDILSFTGAASDLFIAVRKDATKLDKAERDDITTWVKDLKKAGLASADIAFLVVQLEQARGARKDAFTQTLMQVSEGLTSAVLPMVMQDAASTGAVPNPSLTELLASLQEVVDFAQQKAEESPEQSEEEDQDNG